MLMEKPASRIGNSGMNMIRIMAVMALFVLFCGEQLFAQEPSLEERFKTVFDDFEQCYRKYGGRHSLAGSILVTFPQVPKFMGMGPEIVPLLVEKIRSYQDKPGNLLRESLIHLATALILDKDPVKSDEVVQVVLKCKRDYVFIPEMWLKWWEEEGKKLYEKRMKELKEKEKAQEKPETQEPKEQLKEKPPPEKSESQPEPEKAEPQLPTGRSQGKSEVQKSPFEKLPESAENVSTDEPESQPQSANWLLLGLTAVAILLAGVVIVLLRRKHKTA
jgi:hypothetical protein